MWFLRYAHEQAARHTDIWSSQYFTHECFWSSSQHLQIDIICQLPWLILDYIQTITEHGGFVRHMNMPPRDSEISQY